MKSRSRIGIAVMLLSGLSTLAGPRSSAGAAFSETTGAPGDYPPRHLDVRDGRPPIQQSPIGESLNALATGFCPQLALTSNGSTSGNARAPIPAFRFERAVYLIRASELAANGITGGAQLHGIGWTYLSATFLAASAPMKVYLENTADVANSKSTSWSTATTGMTLVHDAATALPAKSGPFSVKFTGGSPFVYSGGGLYVAFEWGQYAGTLVGCTVWCNSTLASGLLGGQDNTTFPTTLTASNFRPETYLMTENAAVADLSVDAVALYGELALGLTPPVTIRGALRNHDGVPVTNVSGTLQVTGPVTFGDSQVAPSIPDCGATFVSFAPFAVSALGDYTATVSIPSDGVPANDSRSIPFTVGTARYTVNYPGEVASLGFGFNGVPGYIVARFPTLAATRITHVNLQFSAPVDPAATYRVAIFGEAGGQPGVLLYLDAADRPVGAAGPVSIALSAPVDVAAGAYYAGVRQTSTVNMGLSDTVEDPVRPGSFFYQSSTTWIGFEQSNSLFRPFIGVSLDRCVTPIAANNGPVCNGTTIQLSGGPAGALSYSWTGPNGFTSSAQNPTISNASSIHAGNYHLHVNGCAAEATTPVVVNGPFTIDATANPGGSVDPSGLVSADCGTNRTFNITPTPGNNVQQVVVDGVSMGPITSHTFTNITSNHTLTASFSGPVSVSGGWVPSATRLVSPRPNPFARGTTLVFELHQSGRVELVIHDTAGRIVRRLGDQTFEAGRHEVPWDGRATDGSDLRPGTYFSRLVVDGRVVGVKTSVMLER